VALFLAIALCAKPDRLRTPAREALGRGLSAWPKSRFAVFPILLGYLAVVSVWSNLTRERAHKEKRELQTRISAEITRSLAEAPSLENLPQLKPEPVNDLFVMHEIAGWVPSQPRSYVRPAEPGGISGYNPYSPSPRRIGYDIFYYKNSHSVMVGITQYPNQDWAKYWVRNTPMPNSLTERDDIKRLSKFGNSLYSDGANFFWSSGDKLILLDCSGILPAVIDVFLKAYLEKYPSSI
jgi:hypothetical protein